MVIFCTISFFWKSIFYSLFIDLILMTRVYQLLHVLEFSSSRKRMSVIMRNEENQLLLLCKGADRFQSTTICFIINEVELHVVMSNIAFPCVYSV